MDFARRVVAAAQSPSRALPLVLVAGPELAGHIRSSDSLGSRVAGVVEVDPAALTDAE